MTSEFHNLKVKFQVKYEILLVFVWNLEVNPTKYKVIISDYSVEKIFFIYNLKIKKIMPPPQLLKSYEEKNSKFT